MASMQFERLTVGDTLPEINKGPINSGHIVRWSAAIENWHPLHYDWRQAVNEQGLPDVLVNGSWKQQLLLQVVGDWIASSGWLLRFDIRYRRMNVPGDTLTAWGRITGLSEQVGFGIVELALGLRDQNAVDNTEGAATVVLPLADGTPLPYPFDPAALEA